MFASPVLINPTWPRVGDDAYLLHSDEFMRRVASNVGNMVFLHAISAQVDGINHASNGPVPEPDAAVWGCSNFIHHTREMPPSDTFFERYKVPFVAIGLGAQAANFDSDRVIPGPTLAWLESIIERAPRPGSPNISVRGEYTRSTLDAYGMADHSVVLGCPSHYINPSRELGRLLAEKELPDEPLIAGSPGYSSMRLPQWEAIEQSIATIVDESGGALVCQGPEDVVRLVRGDLPDVDETSIENARNNLRPELDIPEFQAWFRRRAHVFGSVPYWMGFMRTFDFHVGTRIHGTLLSLQAGVPSVCIALDSRHLEMCQTMHLPHVWWQDVDQGFDLQAIHSVVKNFDWEEYDRRRIELANLYLEFLDGNQLGTASALRSLAGLG